MAVTVFLLDPVSGSPTYNGQQTRALLSALFGYAPAGRPLGVDSGVRPGTDSTTVTVSGTTVTVAPHSGIIDAEASTTAGAYLYAVTSTTTKGLTAASGSNDRIDLVSIQVSDPSQGDGTSTPMGDVVITTGVASAIPATAVPATPARSLALAQVYVPKSGTGSPTVTWVASPWDDTGWVTSGIAPGTGVTVLSQRYRVRHNRLDFYITGQFGATVAAAITGGASSTGDYGNQVLATLPTGAQPAQQHPLNSGLVGGNFNFGLATSPAGSIQICAGPPGATITSTTTWSCGGNSIPLD